MASSLITAIAGQRGAVEGLPRLHTAPVTSSSNIGSQPGRASRSRNASQRAKSQCNALADHVLSPLLLMGLGEHNMQWTGDKQSTGFEASDAGSDAHAEWQANVLSAMQLKSAEELQASMKIISCRRYDGLRTLDGIEHIHECSLVTSQVCNSLILDCLFDHIQDNLASLVLSECAYKKLELEQEDLAAKISEFVSQFPPGWLRLQAVQLSLDNLPQQ